MTNAPTIHVSGHYDIADKRLFTASELSVPARQWTCILGRSGVGKSTLLRLIAGLDHAGTFTGQITASDNASLTGRVSFMAQSDLLLPWLTVLENVVLGARLRGMTPDMDRARDLIARVGLTTSRHLRPAALSGGMRQRTALARTLMQDCPVALLDEPFSALDAGMRADMQELSAHMLSGKTVVMVTHDPAEAVRLGHQIVVLSADGANPWQPPEQQPVRNQYAHDTIACQAALLSHLRAPA
ncbi:ATP-binding cassette domain-containing protein [uncultured Tateyamaria sp.]|uniref:ABC transporter ATP-binding protein n=1 Tax=uncultured Tateyamaria sp. TaxID=455651 RepID=UPI0026094FEC|nr:ATP-binding cassette domain-containing protein [uncultured Tateyamaria sp.]